MPKLIEVEIDSVRVSLTNQQRIVILKQVNAERYLPIWIGLYEAEAITIALQEIQVARPQTHDLLKTLIQTLNARLIQVEVVSLSDDVFYGNLILDVDGDHRQVDCRPSDALALAARMRVPIMISEDVIQEELEEQNLEVFEDFLQNFDLDNLASNDDEDNDDDDDDDDDDES